ncbi:MAG: hypothetical protein QW478_13525 [Candidatus Micrarchaeaceae archaeon]
MIVKYISHKSINSQVPQGMRELKPDKPSKNGGRRSKTSGIHEGGTVCEAGTPKGDVRKQEPHTL